MKPGAFLCPDSVTVTWNIGEHFPWASLDLTNEETRGSMIYSGYIVTSLGLGG